MPLIDKIGGISVRTGIQALEKWGACCAIIYGPPGSGKTCMAATATKSKYVKKMLYVDAEAGTRSIAQYTDIDFIDINHWNQIESVCEMFITKNPGYDTVVFDNLSELRNLHMVTKLGITGTPQIQDYGKNTAAMLAFVRFCRDLSSNFGINVILIAWDSVEDDSYSGVKKKHLSVTPKLQDQIPGIVDIIGYLEVDTGGLRVLTFENSKRLASKFRRSGSEKAATIPLQIPWVDPEYPILGDIIDVLKGDEAWPTKKYDDALVTFKARNKKGITTES